MMMMQGAAGAAGSSGDLVLRSNCERCGAPGASNELFAASCRHMTLCMACGKSMAEAQASCASCGATVKTLIKEYKVKRAPTAKQCFLGRFSQGLPLFSTKNSLNWTMRKDIPRPTDPAREKFKITAEKLKSKPWILEDDTGAYQFQGQLEGGQQAIYYILMKHGRDFHAFPAGSWFNFHKLVQYKQLTLEEAEEQMKNRRKTADGYQRWIMKAANGAAAFGEVEKTGRRKEDDDDKKKGAKQVEDDDLAKPEDFDPEDEVDRGDDWEHEETFTDDDEAVGNDPEERDEQPDVPAPPEIKQEEDDVETEEGQPQQGENALSQSGRDMKKLLGKSGGLEESEDDDDEEDEDLDLDNENISSPVLAPKQKEEAADGNVRPPGGPSAASKNKRKVDEGKTAAASKKTKTETKKEVPAVKKESPSTVKKDAPKKEATKSAAGGASSSSASSALEEEVKAVLKESGPMKSQDLVARFRSRLKNKEEKNSFAMVLKKISRIQKRDGASYIVLK